MWIKSLLFGQKSIHVYKLTNCEATILEPSSSFCNFTGNDWCGSRRDTLVVLDSTAESAYCQFCHSGQTGCCKKKNTCCPSNTVLIQNISDISKPCKNQRSDRRSDNSWPHKVQANCKMKPQQKFLKKLQSSSSGQLRFVPKGEKFKRSTKNKTNKTNNLKTNPNMVSAC